MGTQTDAQVKTDSIGGLLL